MSLMKRYELQDRLLQEIRKGNEAGTLRAVKEWNGQNAPKIIEDKLADWKWDLIQMNALMVREVRTAGAAQSVLHELDSEYMRRIWTASDEELCRKLMEEMAVRYCGLVRQMEAQGYSPLVRNVILAVNADLSSALTLQYLSENLGVNRSYLSSRFKREVGITLTDYVTEQRIRYAADLLLTTSYPILTVARCVGITDSHYFGRIFKKKMGKTPGEYRRQKKER